MVLFTLYNKFSFNSNAGGMPVARPNGFGIDFARKPISGSAAWFYVIILKLFLHSFLSPTPSAWPLRGLTA